MNNEYINEVIEQLQWLLKYDLFNIDDVEQLHVTRESIKYSIKILKEKQKRRIKKQ